MNSKRSYLDTLNAGRPRRPYSTLEELNRSLDTLQQRLNRHTQPEEVAPPRAEARHEQPRSFAEMRAREGRGFPQEPSYQTIARDLDRIRTQEDGVAAFGKIAGELQSLREDLRQQVAAGMRREFETMRRDMERTGGQPTTRQESELANEFERLSGAIHALSERADDRSLNLLRLELEQVKSSLDTLAREETVRSVGREFDRRWTDFQDRVAAQQTQDPAIEALTQRLEQISQAVENLPESLSLRSLEEKLRMLAGAVDHFVRQSERDGSETFNQIEERLDEISRAIVASTAAASQPNFDPEPFERIEARISSLARQIEEVANDRPGREVIERLNLLSQRVDDITMQVHLPETAVERLGHQIAVIADKLDQTPAATDADFIFQGIEQRLDLFSSMIERRQGDALEQGNLLFRDLERRLDEVADRLDQRAQASSGVDNTGIMEAIDARFATLAGRLGAERQAAGDEVVRGLETRLDDISRRLDTSARQFASVDPELIRNLEAQVAGLSEHLARPSSPLPEFEDIAPRLDDIERSIATGHEMLLEAARQAAESAVRSLADSSVRNDAVSGLADDLRALEALTRRSDERNTRTFEAIHDTLLKIVDRLGSLEHSERGAAAPAAPKMAVQDTPSLDIDAPLPLMDRLEDRARHAGDDNSKPFPVEVAQAAVSAAPGEDTQEATETVARARFGLGGVFRRKREKVAKPLEPVIAEAATTAEFAPAVNLDEPMDPAFANRPLEPGSGAPDLNAIMRRVRDERQQAKPVEPDAAKADFIAAARRAAQAAAAEAEALKRNPDFKGPARAIRIGEFLKARRKPILMAAAAIMMALAGLQIGKTLMADTARVAEDMPPPSFERTAAAPEKAMNDDTRTVAAPSAADADGTKAANAVSQPATTAPTAPLSYTSEPTSITKDRPWEQLDTNTVTGSLQATPSPATVAPGAPEPHADAGSSIAIPVEAGPVALREAAEAGDAKALFEIGARYADGREVHADLTKAAGWYEKAAEAGFAPAQYRIGNFYEKGMGVETDLSKAKMWYQLAANQGNASAMHNLAVLFAMGADGAPDNTAAVQWFNRAAELGVTDSQFNLGILAAKGVGMQQNLEESYKWFALVAKAGDKDAANKRDDVAKALKPEQLERAKAAAELWKPKPLDTAVNSVDIPDAWQVDQIQTASVDMKQAVRQIQSILNRNGYDAGGNDGVMGQKTKNAVAAFQKANGMDPTGEVDEKVVRALLALK